ncbi:baculoviral IAP repeat containing deterin [Nomia melanderi]|uniref:baculoviral IAP repeat containing deterin n=1 Tax=Nomia melanderi TaxID=2448451 RepID=UPI001304438A|nr:baculoviral IAP repeat-containing protein 5 [Nomia melanderi]XP_031834715.1 baculoviral IAP repeat-containing protein 5 [Nomia melanderi]
MDLLPQSSSTFWKGGRLQTFEHWPFQSADNPCNPERMAAAGFIAIGNKEEPDLAECFICSKQLDGWDPDDDPWIEHKKHNAQCPFVKLNKLDETTWTVQDLFDLFKKYEVKECMRELDKGKAKMKEETTKMANDIPEIYKGWRKSCRD